MLQLVNAFPSVSQLCSKAFFLLLFLTFLTATPKIYAQEKKNSCLEILDTAEHLFFNAAFDEAVIGLESCLSGNRMKRGEKANVYLLLARIHFAKQDKATAAEALESLFSVSPKFELDTYLPPPFVAFAAHIQEISKDNEELDQKLIPKSALTEERRAHNRKWLMIGTGGVFAITAVTILSGGNSYSDVETFPEAPAPPGQ